MIKMLIEKSKLTINKFLHEGDEIPIWFEHIGKENLKIYNILEKYSFTRKLFMKGFIRNF